MIDFLERLYSLLGLNSPILRVLATSLAVYGAIEFYHGEPFFVNGEMRPWKVTDPENLEATYFNVYAVSIILGFASGLLI